MKSYFPMRIFPVDTIFMVLHYLRYSSKECSGDVFVRSVTYIKKRLSLFSLSSASAEKQKESCMKLYNVSVFESVAIVYVCLCAPFGVTMQHMLLF